MPSPAPSGTQVLEPGRLTHTVPLSVAPLTVLPATGAPEQRQADVVEVAVVVVARRRGWTAIRTAIARVPAGTATVALRGIIVDRDWRSAAVTGADRDGADRRARGVERRAVTVAESSCDS